jgi:hypothetical protein
LRFRLGCRQRSRRVADADDYRCADALTGMLRRGTKESPMPRAAQVATIGFAGMIVFEVALAAGARLGDAAWGGAHAQLTTGQRFGSAVKASGRTT